MLSKQPGACAIQFAGRHKLVHGGLAVADLATGHPRNGQHIPLPDDEDEIQG